MSEISDLMAKDPLSMTREDITTIIQKYRDDREKFMVSGKATRTPKAKADPEVLKGLSLDDLDL